MKIYKSSSSISINVNLPGGGHRHISFLPRSNGSVYYSHDEQEQMAIESHHGFNNLFYIDTEAMQKIEASKQAAQAPKDEVKAAKRNTGTEIRVSDLAAARDYLSDKLGISRTKMRSEKAILEVAKANGITFIGL